MKCPICNQYLIRDSQDCYFCEHGLLVTGKFVSKAKSSYENLKIEKNEPEDIDAGSPQRTLICPNCSSDMKRMDYLNSGVFIDTCINCSYRWLDDGELEHIRSIKPKLSGEDLLFISNIENKIQKERRFKNTKVPYFNFARYLSAVSYGFGDKKSTGPAFITSLGLFGAIKLLLTRTGRILLLIIIILFGLLAWSIVAYFRT